VERNYIQWLTQTTQSQSDSSTNGHLNVILGIGDDAAIVDFRSGNTVMSTDMLADGVHFVVGQTPLNLIGRKAIAVNLSDLAAMAARPVCAMVSLMLPRRFGIQDAQSLTNGMLEIAAEFGIAIVGGDTNRWDGPLVINVAIAGLLDHSASADTGAGWRISDALPGDSILVSGDFGQSINQKHLTFTPKVALALYLRDRYTIHAATDITDSLTVDLASIAAASGLGLTLDTDAVPISQDALTHHGHNSDAAIHSALYDGEDFELAITVDRETSERILRDPNLPHKMCCIGTMTDSKSMWLNRPNMPPLPLTPQGYEH
jgi:thiamine-monophosphate kinase